VAPPVPCHLSRAQRYQLDAGVPHSYPESASASQRAISRAGRPTPAASGRRRKRLKANQFPLLLHAFFHDWLVQQRNVSHHTVLSYRDSWRLFLRFVAARKTKSVAQISLTDLTATEVLAFLQHTEQERHSSIGTRNCRLAE